jgi:hypothetical protein
MLAEIDALGNDIPLALKNAWGGLDGALRPFEGRPQPDYMEKTDWTDDTGVVRPLEDTVFHDGDGNAWHWSGGFTSVQGREDMVPMLSRDDWSATDVPWSEVLAEARVLTHACQGFAWIGQPWHSCDRCGQPAWEHEGPDSAPEVLFGEPGPTKPWASGWVTDAREAWLAGHPIEVIKDDEGRPGVRYLPVGTSEKDLHS